MTNHSTDPSATQFSHVTEDGAASMVDVSPKAITRRTATATGSITTTTEVLDKIRDDAMPKGAVLSTARIAGIQAGKQTSSLIPLCHPLPLHRLGIEFDLTETSIVARAHAVTTAKTGVEMEVLTAVSVALLTVYDMIKAVDKHPVIGDIHVVEKAGGQHGSWNLEDGALLSTSVQNAAVSQLTGLRAVFVTASTRAATSTPGYPDQTGPLFDAWAQGHGIVAERVVVADGDPVHDAVTSALATAPNLVIVSGGTGINPHDETPEQVAPLLERALPGIMEEYRRRSASHTPFATLSRGVAGVTKGTFIVTFPGSPDAVETGLELLDDLLPHITSQLAGGDHTRHNPDQHDAHASHRTADEPGNPR